MNRYEVSGEVPKLLAAVFKGPEEVLKILNDPATPATVCINVMDRHYNTAILIAAGQGNIKTIKLLLDKGANIKDKNFYGKTVLHFASAKGHESAVRLLLERGADLGAEDSFGCTALHSAVEGDNLNILKLFLKRGINLHTATSTQAKLLHHAAREDNLNIANFLIEQGADVNEVNFDGMTPLLCASEKGSIKVARLLLERGADVFAKDKYKSNVLHFACECGNERLIKLFLNLRVDVNGKGYVGRTPLHFAAKNGDLKSVQLLLDYGAAINAKDENGRFALHWASEGGYEKIVRFLLSQGAFLFSEDNFKRTMLHSACKSGNENITRLFIKLGINLRAKDNDGKTALHFAVANGNLQAVKMLLDYKADIGAQDIKGKSCLSIATDHQHQDVAKLLLERGTKFWKDDLYLAVRKENEEIVKALLNRGVDAKNVVTGHVYHNHCIVEKLLDYRAECDKDEDPDRIFFWHMIKNHKDASLQLYLDYQFHYINFIDKLDNGWSLIRIALHCGSEGAPKLITRIIIKMKSQNLYICDRIWKDVTNNVELNAYRRDCEREIKKIKSKAISRTSVTYGHILLSLNSQTLASYARNEEIVEAVKSNQVKEKFPIYASFLYNQVRKGMWRKFLLDQGTSFYTAVTNSRCTNVQLPKLPLNCIELISSFLSNRDLRMMIRAYKFSFDLDIHDIKV